MFVLSTTTSDDAPCLNADESRQRDFHEQIRSASLTDSARDDQRVND